MDESSLRDRLDRIERRQRLVVALLVVPYLVGIAELVGYWTAGVVYAALGVVGFALLAVSRRRDQNTSSR